MNVKSAEYAAGDAAEMRKNPGLYGDVGAQSDQVFKVAKARGGKPEVLAPAGDVLLSS